MRRSVPSSRGFVPLPFLILILVGLAGIGCRPEAGPAPRRVVLLLGDGMGPSQITMARNLMLERGERFAFEELPVLGLVTTYSASNLVTDSAAAATAISSGSKTLNQYVGVDPEGEPVESIADIAQRQGWKIGYVTNTSITHATPAGFYASVTNRYTQTDQIALDLLEQAPDVVLAGGWRDFLPPREFGRRQDNRFLLDEAVEDGYTVWREATDLATEPEGKVLGLFAGNHLPLQLDWERVPPALQPPSLPQLTRRALELLSRDDESFFLLVEGGRIDHAGHAFDAKGVAHEMVDFDATVREVLAFAEEHPDTLVLVTADHATGGLAINEFVDWTSFDEQQASVDWVTFDIRDIENPADAEYVRQMTGLAGLEPEDVERIRTEGDGYEASRLLGRQLGIHQGITWVHDVVPLGTGGHTGEDVSLFAQGPGAGSFGGPLDNTEIPIRLCDLLGWPRPAQSPTATAPGTPTAP